ncbi:MAG: site-2 protease family protein [Verrucomicrobiota bacterium]
MSAPPAPYVIMPQPELEANQDKALLEAVRALDTAKAKTSKGLWLFLAVLFLALGGTSWGWASVVGIGIAVLLHELGHVLAMLLLGYKNVQMLFIPLLGGLAMGQPQVHDGGRNALVSLAGPVFGFVTTAVAGVLAYFWGSPSWLVNFVWISLGLNAFNLLPFFPLDGGQVMNETVFARVPVLEQLFRLAAAAALGYLAWLDKSWILGAVAFLNLITIDAAHRRACMVKRFWCELRGQPHELDEALVARLRAAVLAIHPKLNPAALEKNMPVHVKGLWLDIQKSYPGFWYSAGILTAYGFTLVILMPVLAYMAKRWLGAPEFWSTMGV